MMQKTHGQTTDVRYFWNVKTATGTKIEYRSRHSTAKEVRAQLRKQGMNVVSCTPAKA